MKAAVYNGPPGSWPEKPIRIEEVPAPVPGPKEVLVKVAACGMCHTDLLLLQGAPMVSKLPIIIGHEPAGTVAEVGSEVKTIQVGQRVIVFSIIPCHSCDACLSGRQNTCNQASIVGINREGAFAEYIAVPEYGVYPIPDGVSLEDGCTYEFVSVAYRAVYERANVRPGDTVAIYGASGGIGLMCVQQASAIGAHVIGIGRKKWKLEKAVEFGASEIICSEEVERLDRTVRQMTNGGADISIDATGVPNILENAIRSTRKGGKIVGIGLSFEKIQIDINRLVFFELSVMGSQGYNPSDISKVFELMKKGIIKPGKLISHRFKLEDINEAYRMLERGELLRGIIMPSD